MVLECYTEFRDLPGKGGGVGLYEGARGRQLNLLLITAYSTLVTSSVSSSRLCIPLYFVILNLRVTGFAAFTCGLTALPAW